MNKNSSAIGWFNQFTQETNKQQLFGFTNQGATIITTNKELAIELKECAELFACENGQTMPIDLSEIGITLNGNIQLSQNARNVILIKSDEVYPGKEYFDRAKMRFNPTADYLTAIIINNKKGAEFLINSSVDALVDHHIQANCIDVDEQEKFVPRLSMVMSQEDNPGIQLHFQYSHQFKDAAERIKWLVGLAKKKIQSSTDNLSTDDKESVFER